MTSPSIPRIIPTDPFIEPPYARGYMILTKSTPDEEGEFKLLPY
jgi:hypothetical protein